MKKNESGEVETGLEEEMSKKEPDQESSEDSQMMVACARLSSERYRAFIENIGEGVYEVDIHGNFLYFNNSLCRIFGYSREELQFQNFAKFMDEEHGPKAFKTFNRIYETEQGISKILYTV